MAMYHRIETPENNKQQTTKEYSVIANNEQIEIPERYIKAAAQVEALRRLCEMEEKNSEYPALDIKLIRAVIGA